MDAVRRSAAATLIVSFAIVFIAIAPDVMASRAKAPKGEAPRTAAGQSLPAPLQAQLRHAAMQDSPPGLHLSDDGANYTFTASTSHAKGGERAPYIASLACDPSQGVEVTAGDSEYSLRLVPLLPSLMKIRREGEGLAYATPDGSVRLLYAFKRNGLKEDIVLSQPPASDWTISFQMPLDPMLEAKQDAKGNILVYGPDSVLSGFIQTGDDASARLVMKARSTAPKTNLLYIIPAPVVTDGMGQVRSGATFSLKPGLLELNLRGAQGWPAPLTIDPSIVVSTTADFGAGNNEGMISFDTDAISRAVPSGGALAEWGATSSFETARNGHTSVAYNGYLYVIGGQSPGYLNDVQVAPMASDGSLGAWSTTTGFPGGRYGHTSVAYNGYLYVIGGRNSSYLNDVRSAPIHSDGTVGAWSATTSFATARYEHTSVVYNGYLYVIGGRSSSAPLNDIQVAPINANGTVGAWSATTSFSTARYWHTSAAYNGHLYIIGGRSPGFLNDVQVAPINSDGTVGAWSATTSLPTARFAHASVAFNGYLYVFGGDSGGTSLNDVQCAPILASGQLGSWSATTSFTTARFAHASVACNGYLYIIGGQGSGSLNDVQVAPIGSGEWNWNATESFTTGRALHTSVACNGYLYVIGGLDAGTRLDDIQVAPINPDGTLGPWNFTTSLPTTRSAHSSAACDGYLYVIGGQSDEYGNMKDVEFAPINSDGTIGAWSATTFLPGARWCHASAAYNGFLYVTGGSNGAGSYFNDVQVAPINSNGTLGAWSATSIFSTARWLHASVVYNGYLYVIGGSNGINSYLADVQVAPINADGTLGAWSATTSFPVARASHTSVAYDGYLYVIGGFAASGHINNIQYAPIQAGGAVGGWNGAITGFPTGRSSHTSVAENGYLYVIGGSVGQSSLNDVQFALVGPSGTLGAWSGTTSFYWARFDHTSVATNGYLYVLGGSGGGSNSYNDVQYAPIHADGTVGTWSWTTSLPTGRYGHASVAYQGYLYVIGGRDNSGIMNQVRAAPINSDGTLGAWFGTTSLSTALWAHAAVAYRGYLYVLGGFANSGILDQVRLAPIHSNGTLGAWSGTTSFNAARAAHTSVVYGGYLYVIGGRDLRGDTLFRDVQVARMNPDGTVGNWTNTTSLPGIRKNHTSVACNGYLYVLGGNNTDPMDGSGSLSDVQVAPIHSDGRLGGWGPTTSFPIARNSHASVAWNGYLYVIGGFNGFPNIFNDVKVVAINTVAPRAAYSKLLDLGSDQVVESLQFDSTAGRAGTVNLTYAVAPESTAVFGTRTTIPDASPGTPHTSGLGCGRYLWVRADLDDTNSATVDGGGTLGRMDILDFVVTYDSQRGVGDTLDAAKTTQVHLTWDAAPGATSYNVNRCDASAGSCTPSLLGTTADLYYDDNVLGNSSQYWYTVQAVNGACVSP